MAGAPDVRHFRWASWDGTGLEACTIRADGTEFLAEGVIVSPREEGFAARYALRFDGAWHIRSVSLAMLGAESSLLFSLDGDGKWHKEGAPLPDLNYAIAADIAATPLTNTFAIRRLNLHEGESADIQVAHVEVPSLAIRCEAQRYTCLTKDALYRFEAPERGVKCELAVDRDGFIVEYPDHFRRVS